MKMRTMPYDLFTTWVFFDCLVVAFSSKFPHDGWLRLPNKGSLKSHKRF